LQQILAALPAAVIILDANGNIIDCNNHALDFLGEPLLGWQWREVSLRSLQSAQNSPHEAQLRDGRQVSITRNLLSANGEQLILLSDVSEVRNLQDAMARHQHLTAMGEMVAGLAHQVRTPLATAILYASHTVKPELDELKRRQFSAKILERLHYLERQVNDMLIFARQGRLQMQHFLASALLSCLEDAMESHPGLIRIDNRSENLWLLGNQDALRGALLNLLNNAVEAGATEVDVRITADNDQLSLVIEDNGPGISAEQQLRIFEPFFTTKASGTGLGLAVVQSVVNAHRGTLNCESQLGSGTRFIISLALDEPYRINLSAAAANGTGEHCYETV
jgi:two-component system sensor histidine kinase FlrB